MVNQAPQSKAALSERYINCFVTTKLSQIISDNIFAEGEALGDLETWTLGNWKPLVGEKSRVS